MSVRCCECKAEMGHKDGEGVSDGICRACMEKNHPAAYAWARERAAMARGAELLAKRNDPLDMEAFARVIASDLRGLQAAA